MPDQRTAKAHRSAALALMLAFAADHQAAAEEADELIHSDVPLWTQQDEHVWPRHVTDPDGFGCAHRIRLGDWALRRQGREEDPEWFRLGNYGVIHCYVTEQRASTRDMQGISEFHYSVFIDLGPGRDRQGRDVELWALQSGARPGSDYLLLAQRPSQAAIETFDVLQRACPARAVRGGQPLDILITRYCAINSQADLVALARRMATLMPLGTLSFVGPTKDDDP